MNSRYDNDSGSNLGPMAALAFIVIAVVSGFAFAAAGEGVFQSESNARLHVFASPRPAEHITAEAAPEIVGPHGVDMTMTSSTMTAAADIPACDMEACARAYRSFRQSDCTYQPYDGSRKLCTR